METELIIALSIAGLIILGSIVFLLIHLVKILKTSKGTFNNLADTAVKFEKQTEGIMTQTTILTEKTDVLSEDFTNKSSKLDNLFNGLDELASIFNKLTQALGRLSANISRTSTDDIDKASQAIGWGATILKLKDKE